MKKLTKDQKYYRKKKEDSKKDFRKTKREDGTSGVRVTRKSLCVKVSIQTYERLVDMSKESGIKRWEMLTRIINLGLPRYSSNSTSMSPTNRYEWDERLLNGLDIESEEVVEVEGTIHRLYQPKKIKYKGSIGDKQITYDISSTSWKKLECHKTSTGLSKGRIVQFLILRYQPLSKEYLEKQKLKREEYKREQEYYESGGRYYKEYQHSKFLDCGGGHIIHKKGIKPEHWDDNEWDEYCRIVKRGDERMKEKMRLIKEEENRL